MYFNGLPEGFGLGADQGDSPFMKPQTMGYNDGIGSLASQQVVAKDSNPAPQLSNVSAPPNLATTTGLGGKSITPLMPYQRPTAGKAMAGGGVVHQTLAKGGVVADGIAALRGNHPDPRSALAAYDEAFGPDATAELMRSYANGGVVRGPGSGVADLVPGSIDGREDVRIASGEYVVPAWAVSALGDGSTEAGAAILDDMVARLREAGSELIMGTEPINPNEFLPA